MKDAILRVNEEANVKKGYGKATLNIVNGMVATLRENGKLPKGKDDKEYPVDLYIGQTKEGLDMASLTFNTGSSALRYRFNEYREITSVFYNASKFTKGTSFVPLKDVDTEIKPSLLEVLKAYPSPEDPAQQRLYNVLSKLNNVEKNSLLLQDGREVIDVYAQLRTFENGKREGEQYIAVCSHTSPDKVYDLNLKATGKIDSIVAVDFSQKDEDGHPHTEFAPVSKAKDLIAQEPNDTLRECLSAVLEDKQRVKDTQER